MSYRFKDVQQNRTFKTERAAKFKEEDDIKNMAFSERMNITLEVSRVKNKETREALETLMDKALEEAKKIIAEHEEPRRQKGGKQGNENADYVRTKRVPYFTKSVLQREKRRRRRRRSNYNNSGGIHYDGRNGGGVGNAGNGDDGKSQKNRCGTRSTATDFSIIILLTVS